MGNSSTKCGDFPCHVWIPRLPGENVIQHGDQAFSLARGSLFWMIWGTPILGTHTDMYVYIYIER